jgi:hypothetical protein
MKTQITNIVNQINEIHYGWKDKYGIFHNTIDNTFSNIYILQSPIEIIKSKVGICWDQVELERYLFNKIKKCIETYFIVYYDGDRCPTHTFLIYIENYKYYWLEHSWEMFKGLHEYNNKLDLLKDVKSKFIINELNNKYDNMSLCIYKYEKPKSGLNALEFYKHCESGKNIIV